MDNIRKLLIVLANESDNQESFVITVKPTVYQEGATFDEARIAEKTNGYNVSIRAGAAGWLLLDCQGDQYLSTTAATLEEALARLDAKCAIKAH